MGHDLRYHDEDLQMGSGELQWERAEQEAQANGFKPKLYERQGELENHSNRRGLQYL